MPNWLYNVLSFIGWTYFVLMLLAIFERYYGLVTWIERKLGLTKKKKKKNE